MYRAKRAGYVDLVKALIGRRARAHVIDVGEKSAKFLPPGRISGAITERVLADRLYLRRMCA